MPNFTTWYDVGGFLTSSCFVGQPEGGGGSNNMPGSASSASPCYLLTTTLSDGVHLWQLPSAAASLSSSMTMKQHQQQQKQSEDHHQTVVSRLSVASTSSSDQQQHLLTSSVAAKFTCCTATPDGNGFLCGAADGTLFQGSIDNNRLYPAVGSSRANRGGGAFCLDDALTQISPLGNNSSSSFFTMTVGGEVSIVDLRSKSTTVMSSSGSFFHCGTPLTGSSHIALATDGGFVQLFDLRRIGGGGASNSGSSDSFSSQDAVRTFSLKNQVTAMCALPSSSSSSSTGFVAGTIAGRISTVRAIDAPISSNNNNTNSNVVREEAIALPCDDRYPITHVSAINAASSSSTPPQQHNSIAIVAASSAGSVSFFSKKEFSNPEAQASASSSSSSSPPPWKSWSWKVRGQKPASLCLTQSGSFLGGMCFPILAASYVRKESSNTMSRMCVVSLCEEKLA